MTNTRITDAEIFERRYPVILREFALRPGSGGDGAWKGGNGVCRDVEFRLGMQVSILSERRVFAPYGMAGGRDGNVGRNIWVRKMRGKNNGIGVESGEDGEDSVEHVSLGGKNTAAMQPGERIIVNTPGGGGWGHGDDGQMDRESFSDSLRRNPRHAWKQGSVAGRQAEAESAS